MTGRHRIPTLVCLAFLFVLPVTLFLSVTIGNATLLPADNLFNWAPFHSLSAAYGVGTPQNHLLSDLILENYEWKRFILDSIRNRELPLWNPYLFGGIPFLAAGQHSALYPLSLIYYVLPLDKAYGWFTVVNLGLAGVFMFIFMRTLGFRRPSATLAGVAYQLSGFMIVSAVFPMIIAAAAWLPLILALIERVIQQAPAIRGRPAAVPWVIAGAVAIAMHILAGHIEITIYTALIATTYSVWRLVALWRTDRRVLRVWRAAAWLAVMALLGGGIGAIQLVPLYEVVQSSFRAARSSLSEVMGYGFPVRNLLLWLMPNVFGSPAQHTYFDLFTFTTQRITTASGNTEWGIKNYVEGGSYVGIVTLLLAAIAAGAYVKQTLTARKRTGADNSQDTTAPPTGFFIVLSVFSVGFIFGTPLYAILYYGLPGINQLHSPFRWVYALTISLAVLAGAGVEYLLTRRDETGVHLKENTDKRRLSLLDGLLVAGISVAILIVIGTVVVRLGWPALSPLVNRLFQSAGKAAEAYQNAAVFYSAEARNAVIFAVLLALSCALLLLARSSRQRLWWSIAVIALLAFDLNVAWVGFNPSVDPKLLAVAPDALAFLQQDKSQWRLTTFDPVGAKPLNANAAWLYNLQDIRGYDSIIPRQYVDYMKLIEPQNELQFNRIAPLSNPASLQSPLLDLLNVKYVMTPIDTAIDAIGYTQVFTGNEVRIYRNDHAMPRAFTLPATSALLTQDFAASVQTNDPRQYVMIDAGCGITDTGCVVPRAAAYTPANVTVYKNNEVWVDAQVTQTSWLILADSYYPGWKAYIRPLGGSDKDEREAQIALVDGNFRAVKLTVDTPAPASSNLSASPLVTKQSVGATTKPVAFTVRFKYSPDSLRIGAFISFISGALLALLLGIYLWRLLYHEGLASSPVRRVAKNSMVLTGFNLAGRLIDFAFAILMLRVLGPEGAGKFAFAVVIIGWFDILMNFGLNTFLTREVARDKEHANKYLYNTTVLRLILGFGTAPLIVLIIVIWKLAFNLAGDTATVIILLAVSQLISSMATGLSALFFAYEKAEFPAMLTIVSALISVSLRATALLTGYGIVGLAVASILTNLATLLILLYVTIRTFFVPRRESDPSMRRTMVRESLPLMLNHLLATLFFKVDVPMLEALKGATVVGWYSAAYKYVDAFNIIPAYFTQSIFPVMSRMAKQTDDAMARSYVLSLKVLVIIALPLAVFSTFLAPYMIGLLGGAEFLPHGAIALMIMIWSIPFGWINSITNYALIAVNQQRALTRAFIIGLLFNLAANLVLIPTFSYQAAAVVTILSEVVEGAAFYFYVRRHIARIRWASIMGGPVLAAAAMSAIIYLSGTWSLLAPGLLLGICVYLAGLYVTRALSPLDLEMLAPLLPARFRKPAASPSNAITS